jgi:hypothetical protein
MSNKQQGTELGEIAQAIYYCFQTPNEVDSNLEPANVVDGLYRIAGALHRLAGAIENHSKTEQPEKA